MFIHYVVMLYCYACCCCCHYHLCMSLIVPLVLNIVYGSYSLLWPIMKADMKKYANIYIIYIYIHHASRMTTNLPLVCHENTAVFLQTNQPSLPEATANLRLWFGPSAHQSPGAWIWRGDTVDTPSSGYIRITSIYMVINHPQKERMSCMRFIIFQAFAGCLNLTLCTDTWRCSMESCCLFMRCLKCSVKSMFSVSSLFHAGACSQFEKHVSMFV